MENNPLDRAIASDNTNVVSARSSQKLNAVNKIISALHAIVAKSTSAAKKGIETMRLSGENNKHWITMHPVIWHF